MNKVTVKDLDVNGKKVFIRCDFNVPMDENLNITDKTRIVAALPTIKYLLDNNAKIILCSHLGRPKGEFKPEFSLAPVAKELSNELGKEVKLTINTGWLLKNDIDDIESLMRSKKVWFLGYNEINLTPVTKTIINDDTERELIEFSLEFLINRKYDAETYSL